MEACISYAQGQVKACSAYVQSQVKAWSRDGKMYKRASNAYVNLLLSWVKSVPILRYFVAKVRYVAISRFSG